MVWHAATGFVQLDHQKVILGQTVVAKMFINMYDTYSLAKGFEKTEKMLEDQTINSDLFTEFLVQIHDTNDHKFCSHKQQWEG